MISPIDWQEDALVLLDQRLLPAQETYLRLTTASAVIDAIRDLVVRGAPAIGITAAFGLALGARRIDADPADFRPQFDELCERMNAARPTAVNLSWAVRRQRRAAVAALADGVDRARDVLLEQARLMLVEDVEINRAIGRHGAGLVPEDSGVLTHCNAGALATGGYGTALGVVRAAAEQGRQLRVLADETRPFLQGARLTAWELQHDGIDCTVITDGMVGYMMRQGRVDLVIVGADRVAANGDIANKIGTYGVAVLAREHGIPFYVAAPTSTVDLDVASGDLIPIEERSGDEVAVVHGHRVVPEGVPSAYPAFDITPARLVTAIITEEGVARPPFEESLAVMYRERQAERD